MKMTIPVVDAVSKLDTYVSKYDKQKKIEDAKSNG